MRLGRLSPAQTGSAALQLLSGTLTAIYFGQLLGRSALAVASAFFPIFFLLVSFLIGLIAGGIVLVARAHGAGDRLQVKNVTGTTLVVCGLLSLAIAIVGYQLSPGMLAAMATPPDILEQRPAAVAAHFGPEDGRPRGGGAGADPGNHPGEVQPPSKMTGTR